MGHIQSATWIWAALGLAVAGCSSADTGFGLLDAGVADAGNGGAQATGGDQVSGGITASGGDPGSGGDTGTGGNAASGGDMDATGGESATGATMDATGGESATGGGMGSGGDPASGGSATSGGDTGGSTEPPTETCYQLFGHGAQTPDDTSPMNVPADGTYTTFRFQVPWNEPSVAKRLRTLDDAAQTLQHWFLFESRISTKAAGTWQQEDAALIYTGTHPQAVTLLASWIEGQQAMELPAGIGLRMPPPGSMLELEFHTHNSTGSAFSARPGVEICVVPESTVMADNIADLTVLGTEDVTVEAGGVEVRSGGPCIPSFAGSDTITVDLWRPMMRRLGVASDVWVMRDDGSEAHVLSQPFDTAAASFTAPTSPLVLQAGDELDVQCVHSNPTASTVRWHPSVNGELCYFTVLAHPAGSLHASATNNNTLVNGATNGCLAAPSQVLTHAN